MNDKHNHDHHEPPHDPHGKKPKKEKRRRRHGGFILVLILIIVILILILLLFNPFGWGGGSGFLGGKGNNSGDNNSSTTSVISDTSSEISDTVVIRISENTITIDGEECADENALREKVTDIGTKKKYEIDHSTAIKETYDKVKAVLTDLQDALGIEVNYNE